MILFIFPFSFDTYYSIANGKSSDIYSNKYDLIETI